MAEETSKAIVIDTGSGYCKAGMAGDESPACCFPTVYAKDENETEEHVKHLVGNAALAAKDRLNTTNVISKGKCTDWDAIEFIWQYCFLNQLKLDSTEHPLLTSCYVDENKAEKENVAMIFFETFSVPGYYCMPSSLMCLYGSGKTTGVVLESGHEITSTVAIQEGYTIAHSYVMEDFGGRNITDAFRSSYKNPALTEEIASQIKEKRSYISLEYKQDYEKFTSGQQKGISYELPDGSSIEIGLELLVANEAIFSPDESLSKGKKMSQIGVVDMIEECLMKVEVESRKEYYNHIILGGGNTLQKNYSQRVINEISARCWSQKGAKVFATNDRQYLAWIGGGIATSISTFQSIWITQADYQENGPSVIYRKCL